MQLLSLYFVFCIKRARSNKHWLDVSALAEQQNSSVNLNITHTVLLNNLKHVFAFHYLWFVFLLNVNKADVISVLVFYHELLWPLIKSIKESLKLLQAQPTSNQSDF